MEASGTSGMKAVFNGVLNCSIVDGWWAEAYEMGPDIGWTIGKGEDYENPQYQDQVESNALYNLLEKEIVPLFYDRGVDGIPWGWIKKVKESMRMLAPLFNTNRMVHEYMERFYLTTSERFKKFSQHNFQHAKEYRKTFDLLKDHWKELNIVSVEADTHDGIYVNSDLEVRARIDLGTLSPELVDVQVYFGSLDSDRNIFNGKHVSMEFKEKNNNSSLFVGKIASSSSGLHGYTIRILPKYEGLVNPFEWHLINWR